MTKVGNIFMQIRMENLCQCVFPLRWFKTDCPDRHRKEGRELTSVNSKTSVVELLELMSECKKLDAEVRFCASGEYFTVMVWRGWDSPDPQDEAKHIQTQVRELVGQYPQVACYCFDKFSTLLYAL